MKTAGATPLAVGHRADRRAGEKLALSVICMVTLAVLLARVDARGIWIDEVFSLQFATASAQDWLRYMALGDVNGLFFNLVLRGLVAVAGDGIGVIRLPSILAWVAGIPLFFALARRLAPSGPALAATAFYAAAPLGIRHAMEARMYTFAAAASLAATLALIHFADRPSGRRALLYATVVATALYTHYFIALLAAGHAAALTLHPDRRELFRRLRAAALIIGAAAIPLAVVAAVDHGQQVSWLPPASPLRVYLAFAAQLGQLEPRHPAEAVLAVPALLLVTLGLLSTTRPDSGWLARLVAATIVVPATTTLAVSLLFQSLLLDRYLIVMLPSTVLSGLLGARRLAERLEPPRVAAIISLAALALVPGLTRVLSASVFDEQDFRGAANLLVDHFEEGDLVVTFKDWATGEGSTLRLALGYHIEETEMADRIVAIEDLEDRGVGFVDPPPARLWVAQAFWADEPGVTAEAARVAELTGTSYELVRVFDETEIRLALLVPSGDD